MKIVRLAATHLLLMLVLSTVAKNLYALNVGPNHSQLQYTGRWDHAQLDAPSVSWSGSKVAIRFKGEKLFAELSSGNHPEQFRVIINNVASSAPLIVTPQKKRYLLANKLSPDQPHTVELLKESQNGEPSTFYGFSISDGQVYTLAPRPKMKILFIGDTGLAKARLQGGYYNYPATVTRALNAEMHLLSHKDATLTNNDHNSIEAFLTSLHFKQDAEVTHQWFKPHVIVIHAGANDLVAIEPQFETASSYELQQALKDSYQRVIKKIRTLHGPTPHIVLLNAYGWHLQEPTNFTHELSDELGEELGKNVTAVVYPWFWQQRDAAISAQPNQTSLLIKHLESLNIGFKLSSEGLVARDHPKDQKQGDGYYLINGGFESATPPNPETISWHLSDPTIKTMRDESRKIDGGNFLRINEGSHAHQIVDATGDAYPGGTKRLQSYKITAMIRSHTKNAVAELGADFERQALHQRKNYQKVQHVLTTKWQAYSATFTAPIGTWKTYITLKSAKGTVDFDDITLEAL